MTNESILIQKSKTFNCVLNFVLTKNNTKTESIVDSMQETEFPKNESFLIQKSKTSFFEVCIKY